MTLGPQIAAPGRVHDGYNIDSTVQMLTALTPEARTMVLATMPPVQRWKVLSTCCAEPQLYTKPCLAQSKIDKPLKHMVACHLQHC
jgi:hypothetical protein